MLKIPLGRKSQLGFTPFKWGFYFQIRVGLRWRHMKIGLWTQRGLRVSTRRQVKKLHKRPRYVTALRVNLSYWTSTKGKQGRPMNLGFQVYWGRSPK